MNKRNVIAVAVLMLAVCGMTLAQQQTQPTPAPNSPAGPFRGADQELRIVPHMDGKQQQQVKAEPGDMTIDQLIAEVKKFREQKAELEKKEQACLKVLQAKAAKQKEQIDSLIGVPQPVTPPAPTAISLPITSSSGSIAPNP